MGDLVRRYRFTYDYSPITGRSRLIRFQEFGSNGIDAKPPEVFQYESRPIADTLLKTPLLGVANFGALQLGQVQYYGTLQYPDLNGDGRADVCLRGTHGVECRLSTGNGFSDAFQGPGLEDRIFADSRYFSTIRYPDFNGDGKSDICFRAPDGVYCYASIGNDFQYTSAAYVPYPDSAGYDQPQYLRTLQYPDVNGDGRADICIRDSNGIECRLSEGNRFGRPFRGPAWSDSVGFAQHKYYSTITFVDINGDSKADVCVRNSTGIICHLSIGNGFAMAAIAGPAWTDAIGFDQTLYYSSIRYTDLNHDGKTDLCARVAGGLDCYYSTGDTFVPAFTSSIFSDASGFNTPSHIYSLQLIDLNRDGLPEACGRRADGLYCHRGTGNNFAEPYFFSILSDANGFNQDTQPYIFIDHNADGVIDLCYAKLTGIDCFISESIYADSLVSLQTSSGSIVQIFYTTIAQEPQGIAPTALHSWPLRGYALPNLLVKRVLLSDGRGNTYSTRYDYEHAVIKWGTPEEIQDLGFRKIRETDENTGKFKQTFFIQNVSDAWNGRGYIRHTGKIELEHEYAGTGEYLRGLRNEYYDDDSTVFPGTKLSRLKTQWYETTNGARNLKSFSYDNYGNVRYMIDRFDPSELLVAVYNYEYDLERNILNRKVSEKQLWDSSKDDKFLPNGQFADPSGDDKIIKWTRWQFVDHNLVREEKYLDTQNDFLVTHYQYDSAGRRTGVTSARGMQAGDPAYTTIIEYDSYYQAQPVRIRYPSGLVVSKELDSLGINVVKEIDANGNATVKKYDRLGELKEIIEPGDDWTKRIIFVNLGNPNAQYMEVQYRQGTGAEYRFERSYFDGLKRVYREVKTGWSGAGGNHTITVDTEIYNSTEKIQKQSLPYSTGQNPVYRTLEYDSAGRLKKHINPDGSFKAIYYSTNNSTTVSLENGKFRLIQYDARNRKKQILEQITDAAWTSLAVTTFSYGYLEQTTVNPDGQVLRQKYDTLGRQIQVVENGKVYSFFYDNDGNIAYSTNPKGEIVRYAFDAQNRMTLKDLPGTGGDVRFYYDSPEHANGRGRVTKIEDASGITLLYYDAKGNVSAWSKAMEGSTFTFQATYDPEKRLQKIRYPDGDEARYLYHTNGVLHQVLLKHNGAESPVVTYSGTENPGEFVRLLGNNARDVGAYSLETHKPLSLRTLVPIPAGDNHETVIRDLSYQTDPMGNITRISDNLDTSQTQTFSYDGLNRMLVADGPYGNLQYEFSKGGKLLSKGGKWQYFNDETNPQAVTNTVSAHYQYDNNGNLIERNSDAFSYDAENRLVSAELAGNNRFELIYDFAGIRAIKRTQEQVVYYLGGIKNYGALYELVRRNGYLDAHTKYIYGIQSDRVAQVTRSDVNIAAMMNFNNHAVLASLDTRGFGNFAVRVSHVVNAWLIHPHLSKKILWYVIFAGCVILLVLFTCSALRRQSELQQRAPAFFYSIPLTVCAFFFFVGCSQSTGLPNNGAAWADLPSSTDGPPVGTSAQPITGIYFYHPDHLGSTTFVTNAAGHVVTTLYYLPYGEFDAARSSGLNVTRYKFTGQEEDSETGLYNYNARHYNPESGTFITQDTIIPGDGERSQGFNRYMYTEGNPIRWNDPTGHFIIETLTTAAAAFITVGSVCGFRAGCPTTPFWHQYTGPNKRCPDFSCEPTTALDRISQKHDLAGAELFNFKKNIDELWNNIKADADFIKDFTLNTISGALVFENFFRAKQQLENAGLGTLGSWVGAVYLGIYYTVTDIGAGVVGSLLFVANIVVTAVVIFFKWLFGREAPPCDAECQKRLQIAAGGRRINVQPAP